MKRLFTIFLSLVFAAVLAVMPAPAAAEAEPGDITESCQFAPSSNAASFRKAVDGRTDTVWRSEGGEGQEIGITVGGDAGVGGLYFRWDAAPDEWTLTGIGDDGESFEALRGGGDGVLADYAAIPALYSNCRTFTLRCEGDGGFSIAELSVYSRGGKPDWAPDWVSFEGTADILLFSAHPDDEQIYLGAVMPTYAQQGKDTVTVFMTYGKPLRRFEAMESVWLTGERICPVLGPFKDKLTKSLADAKKYWPEDQAAAFVVEQIRKYKPAVVVTHDVKGEYGHGAHIMTSLLVQEAFERSGDPSYYPESAEKYGAWTAAKLYVHLYKTGELTIDTDAKLSRFGGRTAFDMAKEGFSRHFSQHVYSFRPKDTGVYSIRKFGLFASRVGEDTEHDDMFELIDSNTMGLLNPWYVDKSALSAAIAAAKSCHRAISRLFPYGWEAERIGYELAAAEALMIDENATQRQVSAAACELWQLLYRRG